MRQVRTGLVMAVVGLTAVLALSGCPKTPKTATQTAGLSEAPPPALPPPGVEEVSPPIVAEERRPEPPTAETRAAALADVYFEFDRAEVTPAARTGLEENAKWLLGRPNSAVSIEGHADERGTNEYNLALGERRAQAVKRVLAALGVPAARLSTVSYGEEQPACRDHRESCWEQNRRAHLAIK